jgi:putative ATP-binding cassette transporter
MQFTGSQTDNPDQRISEDINNFILNTWMYTFQLLQQLVTLGTFLVILWNLFSLYSSHDFWQGPVFPRLLHCHLPGLGGTGHLCCPLFRPAVNRLNYNQTRHEADFRFSLVRVRENSEQIALLGGEKVEHRRLMGVFNNIVANAFRIMMRNMKPGFANQTFTSLDGVLISLLLGPAYFTVGLPSGYGAIMQISQAFATVTGTFNFFKTMYAQLAAWKAVINRLTGFLDSRERSEALLKESRIVIKEEEADQITLPELEIYLPSGQLMVAAKDIVIPGEIP